jgi:broad specificity phosphatase PhoE
VALVQISEPAWLGLDLGTQSVRAEIRHFKTDPVAHPMPGGEDPRQAASRFVSALRDIAALCPNGRVLVVAHNTVIRLALCSLSGIPLAKNRTVFPSVRNVGLTEIRFENERVALLQDNSPLSTLPIDTEPDSLTKHHLTS